MNSHPLAPAHRKHAAGIQTREHARESRKGAVRRLWHGQPNRQPSSTVSPKGQPSTVGTPNMHAPPNPHTLPDGQIAINPNPAIQIPINRRSILSLVLRGETVEGCVGTNADVHIVRTLWSSYGGTILCQPLATLHAAHLA
eukprot:CAMPEP_0181205150 /NCGR_PEP_ID=MMETSP1096-20121128/20314_1 /TAXON_ID=156174 ORGANISM="Chrysochromulina ericina, Strain CCMP281" /NCGR_SAMPLE_ID=MMETSP1096 /ASSEMBLY_ACC=CAM_ASM_000453 /LENGTH=140 /DNA_ID=CAMNT_0023295895 /DNA_START=289 /DNA_END=709 /DNA_ORIENTATION=+